MSLDLVSIAIEGSVVTDPALTHFKNGSAHCTFNVACDRNSPYGSKDQKPDKIKMFFRVSTVGKLAEVLYPLLKPGVVVRVEGDYHDSIFRDKLTDKPRIGRIIYATRVRSFVIWTYKSKREMKNTPVDVINTDDIPI